jgi:integrase/recombinase XerD
MSKISMSTNELSITDAFKNFIVTCKAKNLASETIKSYQVKCQEFIKYVGTSQISTITSNMISKYIIWLQTNTSANDITIATYIRHVRTFLYFCMNNNYIDRFKIVIPKAEKKIKETYTNDELKILLKRPNIKTCTFREFQIWTLENFLLATGCRISTALNIKTKDIDFYSSVVIFRHCKNRKQQIIPLSNSIISILRLYLQYRKSTSQEDYLFCSTFGKQADRGTIEHAIANYNRSRGIVKTSAHLFRHTFAKLYLTNGGDAFKLQRFLGHSTLEMTKEYVNMFSADLQNNYDKLCPLDNIIDDSSKIKMKR